MKSIGIDIGTTTISIVVIDSVTGRALMSKTIDGAGFMDTDHDWEKIQDPTIIVKKVMGQLEEMIGSYPDFSAIGLTGQMHGIVYLDNEGHYVTPLYTWQDQRGALPDFNGKSILDLLRQKHGVQAAAGYGMVTHLYNVRKKMVPSEAATFCTIMDYIGMKLAGRSAPLVHVSNAASFGLYDVKNKTFRTDVLEAMGADPSLIPEVTDQVIPLGNFRGIPVVTTAIGDNQASFLGSVGIQEGKALVNMGTGGQISLMSDSVFEAPGIETRPFIEDKYLLVGSSLCGGRAYAVLEHFFREYAREAGLGDQEQYSLLNRLAAGRDQTDGLEVRTTFRGTRTNPNLLGRITGITESNFTPSHLARGVMEGMAKELYDHYQAIQEGTGITVKELIASGNGLRKNEALREVFSRKFDAPLQLAKYEEEAACGAAISALMFGFPQ